MSSHNRQKLGEVGRKELSPSCRIKLKLEKFACLVKRGTATTMVQGGNERGVVLLVFGHQHKANTTTGADQYSTTTLIIPVLPRSELNLPGLPDLITWAVSASH
ncbi:hypothetical protein HAX54_040071 [Datura stramonium]|uniref:Uncharacterized protein n=1 Tax=Datura stramonium TaxID=4076 RepID=A0ABS8VMT1_DATST|nr:hypothetical protein [Datura stramonium]